MKIAMLLYNDFVADVRVHKEARDLAAAGHDVLVVTTRSLPDLPLDEARAGYRIARVGVSAGWRTNLRGTLTRVSRERPRSITARAVHAVRRNRIRHVALTARMRARWGRGAVRVATDFRPDVVHAHDLDTLDFGARVADRLAIPLVYDSHELWRANNFLAKEPRFVRSAWQRREARHVGRADAIILTTESRAERFRTWYPGTDPVIVMNCQDGEPTARTRVLRDRLGLGDETRILLYQGLVHRDRGIFVALDALASLPEPFVYVAIGNGGDAQPLARAILERGLERRAYCLPAVHHDELPPVTASADFGLSLIQHTSESYYLSAPNKLFEYMRAGLPVIASDFPEVARLFSHGDLGERVDPADAHAVAGAVVRLASDPARVAAIGARARALVTTRLTWRSQVTRLLEIYARLGR